MHFVVTRGSSGQGMMLACNRLPGVLCGYAPTPKDAYLFAQINNGNAISFYKKHGFKMIGFDLFVYTNTDQERHEIRIEMGKVINQ